MISKIHFKRAVKARLNEHVHDVQRVKFVWLYSGKFPTGLRCRTGYFVAEIADREHSLWYCEYTEKHGLALAEQSGFKWKALSMLDQTEIKNSTGDIPAPAAKFDNIQEV